MGFHSPASEQSPSPVDVSEAPKRLLQEALGLRRSFIASSLAMTASGMLVGGFVLWATWFAPGHAKWAGATTLVRGLGVLSGRFSTAALLLSFLPLLRLRAARAICRAPSEAPATARPGVLRGQPGAGGPYRATWQAPLHNSALNVWLWAPSDVLLAGGRGARLLYSTAHPRLPFLFCDTMYPFVLRDADTERVSRWVVKHGIARPAESLLMRAPTRRLFRDLMQRVAEQQLPPPPGEPPNLPEFKPESAIVSAQHLSSAIATHFGLETGAAIVTFRDGLGVPARVRLEKGQGLLVEVATTYRDRPDDLLALLAHELAHIFLFRRGVDMNDAFETEILTDMVSVCWGFGHAMLLTHHHSTTLARERGQLCATTRHQTLGYLSASEIVYVMAQVALEQETALDLDSQQQFTFRATLRAAEDDAPS